MAKSADKRDDYVTEIRLHAFVGMGLLIPYSIFSFSLVMQAFNNGGALDVASLFSPMLLMVPPLIALYVALFRYLKTKTAIIALALLTCGVSYAALYIGARLISYEASLFMAVFVPYVYVRVIGRGLLKKESAMSEKDLAELSEPPSAS